MKKLLLFLALSAGSASAHTAVTGIQPGAHAVVNRPQQVTLKLNEAVNLRFATFKVYALPAGDKPSLNRAAAGLLGTALSAKNDAARRADTWAPHSGKASTITVPLKADLKPGAYAVLWRFLSEDGHPVSGRSVFNVK